MSVTISSNPFARVTLERRTHTLRDPGSCDWCGNRPGKYEYWYEDSSGRRVGPGLLRYGTNGLLLRRLLPGLSLVGDPPGRRRPLPGPADARERVNTF